MRQRLITAATALSAVVLAGRGRATSATAFALIPPPSCRVGSGTCRRRPTVASRPSLNRSQWLASKPYESRSRSKSAESSSDERPCVVTRLGLDDEFGRWRFLQGLLEAEVDAADANQVIYRVLGSFLDFPRPRTIIDGEGKSRSSTSPIITEERRGVIESLLGLDDREDNNDGGIMSASSAVPALSDPECAPYRQEALDGLERLLPDPRDDEDAHKTGWDLVLEMYGREATKAEEKAGAPGWKARCLVARVLLHYDFLNDGVVEEEIGV